MYLRTLGICALKYMNQTLLVFFTATGLSWQTAFKKIKIKLDLLADIDILLMIERGRVCQAIEQYENGNSKYIKDYDKNKIYSNKQCHRKYL